MSQISSRTQTWLCKTNFELRRTGSPDRGNSHSVEIRRTEPQRKRNPESVHCMPEPVSLCRLPHRNTSPVKGDAQLCEPFSRPLRKLTSLPGSDAPRGEDTEEKQWSRLIPNPRDLTHRTELRLWPYCHLGRNRERTAPRTSSN